MSIAPPNSRPAEESVVGLVIAKPTVLPSVISTGLDPDDFYHAPMRALFEQVVEMHFADEHIDALTVGEGAQRRLSKLLRASGPEVVEKVRRLAEGRTFQPESAEDHALLIKRHADYRRLLELAAAIERGVEEESAQPFEIAGGVAQESMKIATNSILTREIIDYGTLGRRFLRQIKTEIAARQAGVELGVWFDLKFLDDYVGGLRGSELMIVGGEPGVGKSAVVWVAAQRFAQRQMRKPEDRRIGTLILSLEMAEAPSNVRLAQHLTGIDGQRIRRAEITKSQLQQITNEWAARKDLPLFFNFTSTLRASELRALVVEAVRQSNVGLVVIDHFRYFDMDRRNQNSNVEDEEKARFLKENLAKDLDVAVICIAHTIKGMASEEGRPRLRDLRGSGQVAAHADQVAFMYRPWPYASETARTAGSVKPTDAELLWEKNRHGVQANAEFFCNLAAMEVRDAA